MISILVALYFNFINYIKREQQQNDPVLHLKAKIEEKCSLAVPVKEVPSLSLKYNSNL